MRSHLDYQSGRPAANYQRPRKDSARVETLESNHHLIADGRERFQ